MRVVPVSFVDVRAFVTEHHRHNKAPQGHRFSLGLRALDPLLDTDELMGVAIVGRPVARMLDDGLTAEVTRLCVLDHAPKNTCSMLYRAAWRAWREMGGRRIITYTLLTEPGTSLRGAGWTHDGPVEVQKADRWTNRAGRETQAVVGQPKQRWSLSR